MPDTVKKAINRFIEKFPQDTRASTWHVEPIKTFQDSNLRTARVNVKYRLVLRIPFPGDTTWLLIWVGNHDEAMDWAKNKRVDWNDQVQAIQITDTVAVEQATQQQASDKSPHLLDGITDEQLEQIGVREPLILYIRKIQDQNKLLKLVGMLPDDVIEHLQRLFDGAPIANIIRDVEMGKVESDNFADQKQSANNRRTIFEPTGDELLDEALRGDFKAWQVFLHPDQRVLAEGNFRGPIKVTGGAGTGKTVAALHRAQYLSRAGEGLIFFTTYTNSLTERLKRDLRALGTNMSSVRVNNLDAQAMQLAKEFGLLPSNGYLLEWARKWELAEELLQKRLEEHGLQDEFSAKDLQREYIQVLEEQNIRDFVTYRHAERRGQGTKLGVRQREQIWRALQGYPEELLQRGYRHEANLYNALTNYLLEHPEARIYRHVVADEIQDFSMPKLRLLRALVAPAANDLFLVGDPYQKIYRGTTNFKRAGIAIQGVRSKHLRINYRTTDEIGRTAMATLQDRSFQGFDGAAAQPLELRSLRRGVPPTYELFEAEEAEHRALLQRLQVYLSEDFADELEPREIAVAAHSKQELETLAKQLHEADQPYYLSRGPAKSKGDPSGIQLSTLHNLKGHEYKVVFLFNISADTYPGNPKNRERWSEDKWQRYLNQRAALLYVSCSRAVLRLHLSGVGEPCTWIRLEG